MSGNVSNHSWVTDSTQPLGGYWTRASGLSTGAAQVTQPYGMTPITVTENTWIDISAYVGKLFHYTGGGTVEFSNDGISPLPGIRSMNLNPSTWYSAAGGSLEWSTNYPAKYLRIPSLTNFVSLNVYGSLAPIERKIFSVVSETPILINSGAPIVIGEELADDPFVQRVVIDGDPNGYNALVQVEYAGKRVAGGVFAMHRPIEFIGGGNHLWLPGTAGSADNAVILAPSHKVCGFFNRATIYCTAGTIDVDIRSLQYGTWNAAVALRRQSDNLLVTQLTAGEIGILENVSFESMQILQNGAVASNANVIFSDPGEAAKPFIDVGAYGGAIVITGHSIQASATLYMHRFY